MDRHAGLRRFFLYPCDDVALRIDRCKRTPDNTALCRGWSDWGSGAANTNRTCDLIATLRLS